MPFTIEPQASVALADIHNAEVQISAEALIQADLGLTVGTALVDCRKIQEAETDGLAELVRKVAGQDDPGNVSLDQAYVSGRMGKCLGSQQVGEPVRDVHHGRLGDSPMTNSSKTWVDWLDLFDEAREYVAQRARPTGARRFRSPRIQQAMAVSSSRTSTVASNRLSKLLAFIASAPASKLPRLGSRAR